MLVSHAWLREWVSPAIGLGELAKRLTLGGLEVAAVTPAGPPLHKQRVVIGEIVGSEPHPGAPHLKVCQVNVGRRAALSIVCGAPNAIAGGKTAVATRGAKLAAFTVEARRIKGVESAGMLCSAAELGLAEQSEGALLLDPDAPVGAPLADYLDLADSIIELELTPNRGDCLGMLGIAREVSALTGAKLRMPTEYRCVPASAAHLPVELRAPRDCPRYAGRAVRNIDMAARTPDWLAERLRRSGVRSLNVVVDVTNYVMLELGQPMHAFDMDKLAGGIVVRRAKSREKLRLLDGNEVALTGEHLVIADHQKALALAGIMGGLDSAISAATRHIYFESAFFPAAALLGKARQFGMHTDASHRFERGVDPQRQVAALERATQLLVSLAGGEPGPVTDACAPGFPPEPPAIDFRRAEIPRLLGAKVESGKVSALLKRLGMRVTPVAGGWRVVAPSWRSDIEGEHDLVEEVARVVGYDQIAPRAPRVTATAGAHPERQIDTADFKRALVERGYFEAITYSFVDPRLQQALLGARGLALRNPLADNLSVMRRSLLPGLLEAVRANLNRRHERVRLFESGHVFLPARAKGGGGGGGCSEIHRLAAAATGTALPMQWGEPARAVDFFDLKGDLLALPGVGARALEFQPGEHPALHPGRCARIKLGKTVIGHLGQLHPRHQRLVDIAQPVYLFELDLQPLAEAPLPQFSPLSRHPPARRDLAVVVDSAVAAQDVLDTARAAAGALLVDLELFDIYAGERIEKNQKSFAFRLTFQSESSNLTAAEVDAKTDKIVAALRRRLGAQLRKLRT